MTAIVSFEEADPDRELKERQLTSLDDDQLASALAATRRAAAEARANEQMERLFQLVRGMKTIHRIAQQRGLILKRPRVAQGP